ncbi:hypothetical protein L9F63_020270, partial [Diploptera punctata]
MPVYVKLDTWDQPDEELGGGCGAAVGHAQGSRPGRGSQSRRSRPSSKMLLLVVLLVSIATGQADAQCPARCLCFRTTVRCMFLQLDSVPQVPSETTILFFNTLSLCRSFPF